VTANSELATALAFVLQKWKDTGADPVETKPFDELLARVASEPTASEPAPEPEPVKLGREGVAARPRKDISNKLAVLDAEIDAANREAD
jgi:hypothetical protein